MNRKIWRKTADQAADARVLNDGRVHAGGDDGAEILFRRGHFVREDQRIEGDVALDAAAVQKFHEPRQVGLCEIMGAHARVETVEAKVNGIGTVFDGGFGAFPIAGGREQFRARGSARRGWFAVRSDGIGCNACHVPTAQDSRKRAGDKGYLESLGKVAGEPWPVVFA